MWNRLCVRVYTLHNVSTHNHMAWNLDCTRSNTRGPDSTINKITCTVNKATWLRMQLYVIGIGNYPKKQVTALPVEWRNKTARSPDCVASIVIASRLPYHHFMVAATG